MVGGNNNQLKLVDNSGLDGVLGRRGHNLCVDTNPISGPESSLSSSVWLLIAGKAIWCIFWVQEA
jgi:hypothetical protein